MARNQGDALLVMLYEIVGADVPVYRYCTWIKQRLLYDWMSRPEGRSDHFRADLSRNESAKPVHGTT